MRTYRVKVERASEEQEEVPSFELRTIAASNLKDAKHRAAKRFGMKRVKNVAPARREQTMESIAAMHRRARKATVAILELMDGGALDPRAVADMCLGYMSEDEVADMARANDLPVDDDTDNEEQEEGLSFSVNDPEYQARRRKQRRSFEPTTNVCPDCEGNRTVEIPTGRSNSPFRTVPCERCDGAGEVFESVKPTLLQYLVESMDPRVHQKLRNLDWERKPNNWREIRDTFTEQDLQKSGLQYSDIPTYHLGDLYYEDDRNFPQPSTKFTMQPPREAIFFLRVPGEGTFLVNTEGYDYVRYALKSTLSRAKFG